MKRNIFVKEFDVNISAFTKSEKKVLGKLIQAAKLVAPIYGSQINLKYPGANFYPHNLNKRQLIDAANKDLSIIDPYTIVEKNGNKLVAVPYHEKFRTKLLPVAKLLKEAAQITDNKHFSRRLKLQADALLDGAYEAADIYWLSMKPYKINVVIGPIERYEDKLFFSKTAYQSWVGVIDEKLTKKFNYFKEIMMSGSRKLIPSAFQKLGPSKIQVRVDDTIIFSGLIAQFMFTSTGLPNDVAVVERYGAEITIFKSSITELFNNRHHPIFHAIFEEKFQKGYPVELLKEGALFNAFTHEIARQFLQYKDAEQRLLELYPVICEMAAAVLGIKSFGPLLLKGAISQKQIEATLVMFICRAFDWWDKQKLDSSVSSYVKGNAIALNFLISSGALKQDLGLSWPNFTKMYVALSDLSEVLERILAVGSHDEAKTFIDMYGSDKIFDSFVPKITNLIKGQKEKN